jgi:hypothetical protein
LLRAGADEQLLCDMSWRDRPLDRRGGYIALGTGDSRYEVASLDDDRSRDKMRIEFAVDEDDTSCNVGVCGRLEGNPKGANGEGK